MSGCHGPVRGHRRLHATVRADPRVDVVALLDRVFARWDQLAADRGVEKIKTIGDAYMVAGGIPLPREDHAEAIAEMALAMGPEFACLTSEIGHALQVRIGIDTGPVVAGVIGRASSSTTSGAIP